MKIRHRNNVDAVVGNFDYGCGILRVRNNSDLIEIKEDLTWDNLDIFRDRWLRLMTFDEIVKWIK